MTWFFNLFGGRCTAFAVTFTVCGIILAFHGKLDMTYIAFVGAIQSLLVAHSWKEDFYERVRSMAGDRTRDNDAGKVSS
jgi:hypothetical protein